MLDDSDDGARVGVWVAIGLIAFLLFGLIGGLALRQMNKQAAPQAPVAVVTEEALFIDGALVGERVAVVYFGVGESQLDGQAQATLQGAVVALAAGNRRVLISGFHDATGGASLNAELAKARALMVRDWLRGQGQDPARLALRKPETTIGDGNDAEARRVEIWLVD